MDDDDSLDHQQSCPFCGTQDDCEHLALLVDRTHQTAEAGDLMDVFNSRWSDIVELAGDDFDERGAFTALLLEVNALVDASAEYDFEGGGPGNSCSYTIYYSSTPEKLAEAFRKFGLG